MIRKDTSWMEILDERILEYLQDNGPTWSSILIVAKGIRGSEEKIKKRRERLHRLGFILKNGEEQFEISPLGILYLSGEESADALLEESERFVIQISYDEATDKIDDIFNSDSSYHLSNLSSSDITGPGLVHGGNDDEQCTLFTLGVDPEIRTPREDDVDSNSLAHLGYSTPVWIINYMERKCLPRGRNSYTA